MSTTTGYAARTATAPLESFSFERREPGAGDVEIDIQVPAACATRICTPRATNGT